jgi:hypothetical protein
MLLAGNFIDTGAIAGAAFRLVDHLGMTTKIYILRCNGDNDGRVI